MSDETRAAAPSAGDDAAGPTPHWLDRGEYPFESRYADVGVGRMHYVDEGEGRPLVMLHGNPTWSFIYRHLVEALSDATLFVQDWGGPTGVHYAMEHPEAIDSFVVMNTAAWPMTDALHIRAIGGMANTPVASLLNRRYNVPVDWVMPLWFGERSRFTPTLRRHYRGPLADPDDRRGALAFARELLGSTPFLGELWERRREIADAPALICWGMAGPMFRTGALRRWQALLPDARTVEFPTAGHFVQEERSAELIPEVRRFLEERASG